MHPQLVHALMDDTPKEDAVPFLAVVLPRV
jgi:hypothetical protein